MSQPTRARAEFDALYGGVRIHLGRPVSEGVYVAADFAPIKWQRTEANVTTEAEPLRLEEDDARALYEALAEYYGHAAADTRLLRRDYEAERARVDRLIGFAIGGAK